MRKNIIISVLLFLGAFCAEAQHYDRGYETVPSSPFIKKGTWSVGGTAGYSQHINDSYNLLVISNINSEGYSLSVKPHLMYSIRDNMAAGLNKKPLTHEEVKETADMVADQFERLIYNTIVNIGRDK